MTVRFALAGVLVLLTLAGCTVPPQTVTQTVTQSVVSTLTVTASTTSQPSSSAGAIQVWFIGMYGNQTRDVEFTPISDGDLGTASGSSTTSHIIFTGAHPLSSDNPKTEAYTVPPGFDPKCNPDTIGLQVRILRLGQVMAKQNFLGPKCGDGKAWILTFSGGPYSEKPYDYPYPYQLRLDGPTTMYCVRGTLMENASRAGCYHDPAAAPNISFSQDKSAKTLTVISADTAKWSDIAVSFSAGTGCGQNAPTTGSVAAGDKITVTGSTVLNTCTLKLVYIPANQLLGTWDFS